MYPECRFSAWVPLKLVIFERRSLLRPGLVGLSKGTVVMYSNFDLNCTYCMLSYAALLPILMHHFCLYKHYLTTQFEVNILSHHVNKEIV